MFDKDKVWCGITPTLWTNDDFPLLGDEIPFEQCVSAMALAGFQGCSVGHKFPTNREELRRQLALRGLRVSEPWHEQYVCTDGGGLPRADGVHSGHGWHRYRPR